MTHIEFTQTQITQTEFTQTDSKPSPRPLCDVSLAGKVVFVTGGAESIGRCIVDQVVQKGGSVAIVGRRNTVRAAREVQQQYPMSSVFACEGTDVRDTGSVAAAVQRTVQMLGKIDYVVTAAAGSFVADFQHISSDNFAGVVDIDTLGALNVVNSCYDQLRMNRGSVLFVGAGVHSYGVPFVVDSVDEYMAGVDRLMGFVASELASVGVRCNAIVPCVKNGLSETADERETAAKLVQVMVDGSGVHSVGIKPTYHGFSVQLAPVPRKL